MPSLLVTNDFPPKHGGIQSYLYELWRRLPPDETTVLTTAFPVRRELGRAAGRSGSSGSASGCCCRRRRSTRRIDALAREVGADVIFLDPMLPLGLVGPAAHAPRPTSWSRTAARSPGTRARPGASGWRGGCMRGAAAVVAAGSYPARASADAAGRPLAGVVIPPGVDGERFHPVDADERAATRRRFGLDPDRPLVLGVSRLVPRKGFDVVIDAMAASTGSASTARSSRSRAPGATGRRLERRAHGPGAVPRAGRRRRPSRALRVRRRVRDVLPRPVARARGRGLRDRVPRGGRVRCARRSPGAAADRTRRSPTARPATSWRRATSTRCATRSAACSPTTSCGRGWARRRGSRAVDEFAYDRLATLLEPVARGDLSAVGPAGPVASQRPWPVGRSSSCRG